MNMHSKQELRAPTIVYYDGACGLCHGVVRWLLRAGVGEGVYFAPQQGERYAGVLARHPWLAGVDSVVVVSVEAGREVVRVRSAGVLWLMSQVPGQGWARWLAVLPMPLLDVGYRLVAWGRRYFFAKPPGLCPIVPPPWRGRFLD